jgi:hypothetical protein
VFVGVFMIVGASDSIDPSSRQAVQTGRSLGNAEGSRRAAARCGRDDVQMFYGLFR